MFTRVREIHGRQYEYEEHRWREGGKVRSKSILLRCLSPRKKKVLSFSEEQRRKEQAEQERIDRVIARAERNVEKDNERREKRFKAESDTKAKQLDQFFEGQKEALTKKDEGKSGEEPEPTPVA